MAAGTYGRPNMAATSNPNLVDSQGQPSNAPLHMDNGDLWTWALPRILFFVVAAYIAGHFRLLPWIGKATGWW